MLPLNRNKHHMHSLIDKDQNKITHTRGQRERDVMLIHTSSRSGVICPANSTILSFSYFLARASTMETTERLLVAIIVRFWVSVHVCVCVLFLFLHYEEVNDFTSTQNDIVPFALLPRNSLHDSVGIQPVTADITTQFWQLGRACVCVAACISGFMC